MIWGNVFEICRLPSLLALQAFDTIGRTGSFTLAAEQLFFNQRPTDGALGSTPWTFRSHNAISIALSAFATIPPRP
jgi:hypothetical protein